MRNHLWPLLLLLSAGASAADSPAKRPDVGSIAPNFSASATNGKTIKLSDYKGKQTVVLAFFPKIFSGG